MVKVVISFGNQIFLSLIWLQILDIWSKTQKISVCKKLDKRQKSFSPNSDNFLVFFIVFEWEELRKVQWINSNAELRRNYFPVNVSVLTVVFLQQISTNFSNKFCIIYHFLFIYCTFQNSALFKHNKSAKKLSVFGENDSRRVSNFLQTHVFWNFETLIIFLEPAIKLMTGIFDLQK